VALGADVRILTRVNLADAKELLRPLQAAGAEVLALPSRGTASYVNEYSGRSDRHELKAVSDPIRHEDVPGHWRGADLIQLGPLHVNDILPEVPQGLRGLIGLDVQGFFREPGSQGLARLRQFLPYLNVLQVSEADLDSLLRGEGLERFVERSNLKEMIVTRGARGATVLTSEGRTEIPAQAISGKGRVGLGDVFLASYLFSRVLGRGPADAARSATQVCASEIRGGGNT
jgi:sugar/nucleoside kinase (ribokinase family)